LIYIFYLFAHNIIKRAELVATSGLLIENEQIRLKIQEEEREKAKASLKHEIELEREKLK
jgi:hypothetical protein